MVGGAAEPRLQATHRDRCTDSRARMSPRGVDSLASSLTAREGRPLLAPLGDFAVQIIARHERKLEHKHTT